MPSQMTYNDMKVRCLPVTAIVDNFVRGIGKYSYEDFLREIVNSSNFFLEKSEGEKYHKPQSEAHKEPDCISDKYTLDFKLLAAQTKFQAESLFSSQIIAGDGVTTYCVPEMTRENPAYHPIQVTWIHVAFRRLKVRELQEIRSRNDKKLDDVQKDVKQVLTKLEVRKNLFLLFPYNLFFDVNDDFERGRQLALQGVNDAFGEAMRYRAQVCPGFDTYFSFLYARHFVICEWRDNELVCVDMIPVDRSPLFVKLLDLADSWGTRGYLK